MLHSAGGQLTVDYTSSSPCATHVAHPPVAQVKMGTLRGFLGPFTSSCAFLLFLMYPNITKQLLSVFLCRPVGDLAYLVADFRETCYGGGHVLTALGR